MPSVRPYRPCPQCSATNAHIYKAEFLRPRDFLGAALLFGSIITFTAAMFTDSMERMIATWPLAVIFGFAMCLSSMAIGLTASPIAVGVPFIFILRNVIGRSSVMYVNHQDEFHHHLDEMIEPTANDNYRLIAKTRIGGWFRRTKLLKGPLFWPFTLQSWNGVDLTMTMPKNSAHHSVTTDAESVLRLYDEEGYVDLGRIIDERNVLMKTALVELRVLRTLAHSDVYGGIRLDPRVTMSRIDKVFNHVPHGESNPLDARVRQALQEHRTPSGMRGESLAQ